MKKTVTALCAVAVLLLAFWTGSRYGRAAAAAARGARAIAYYVDPMHPSYRSSKPGIAPDCGMALEPVYRDVGTGTGARSDDLETGSEAPVVHLTAERQQVMGMTFATAAVAPSSGVLRTTGRTVADENRTYRVLAPVDGWIEELSPASVGSAVEKGQTLAWFYSREFLSAQQGYFLALDTLDRVKNAEVAPTEKQQSVLATQIRSARETLKSLGMDDGQIDEIARTRQLAERIAVRAPGRGIILARGVFRGQRFDRGAEFYRIADLGHVWILATLFEDQASLVRPGIRARVANRSMGVDLSATVAPVEPRFDAASRALEFRLDAENPRLLLKPGMFVDVELGTTTEPALAVPGEAILDAGSTQVVFVDRGNGYFESRPVRTGRADGDRVEIVSGLRPGERVVVSGNFLLDSEARLHHLRTTAPDRPAAAPAAGASSSSIPSAVATAGERTATDPVCAMKVNEREAEAAGRVQEYAHQRYYFCCDLDARKFAAAPTRYVH